jgi:hypothetical protein
LAEYNLAEAKKATQCKQTLPFCRKDKDGNFSGRPRGESMSRNGELAF